MAIAFSKRFKNALENGVLKISLPPTARVRLSSFLEEILSPAYGIEADADWIFFQIIEKKLGYDITYLGEIVYGKVDSHPIPGIFEIIKSCPGELVFDMIEAVFEEYYESILEGKESFKNRFHKEFNKIMEEEMLPWRMREGNIFPTEPAISLQIYEKVEQALSFKNIKGALQEFRDAHEFLLKGRFQDTIHYAIKALESVLKGVLNRKRTRFKNLIEELRKKEVIPDYYPDFNEDLSEILNIISKIRNRTEGTAHGTGPEIRKYEKEFAEFCLNLVATVILLIAEVAEREK